MSVRFQLLLRLTSVSILLVGSIAWLAYEDVRHEARELFDAQLARSARVILSLAQSQNGDVGFSKIQQHLVENGLAVMSFDFETQKTEQKNRPAHAYETRLSFQIWDNEGNLLLKSYNAPLEPITNQQTGFGHSLINNNDWRTFSLLSNNKRYLCLTAERIDARNDLTSNISNDLFYMFIILIPTLFLIMFISIYQGLKPLNRLAFQIDRRSGDNLELFTDDNDRTEISTIKNALNHLLKRLDETIAREKRITSDAAHELRTPLAAIRLHTELARNAKNPQQQNESLDQVILSVDRTTHIVEQLLILARLESETLIKDFSRVKLNTLINEECKLLTPLALAKDIDVSFIETQAVTINGSEPSLRLLIRNLLNNAIAYIQKGGCVNIRLSQKNHQTTLIVEDNGPGISEKNRGRAMERFNRVENHQVSGGGIGLSIVDRVAKMHQGTLQLSEADSGQGLKVSICFR